MRRRRLPFGPKGGGGGRSLRVRTAEGWACAGELVLLLVLVLVVDSAASLPSRSAVSSCGLSQGSNAEGGRRGRSWNPYRHRRHALGGTLSRGELLSKTGLGVVPPAGRYFLSTILLVCRGGCWLYLPSSRRSRGEEIARNAPKCSLSFWSVAIWLKVSGWSPLALRLRSH